MPSLLERLGSWVSGRKATDAIPFHTNIAGYYGEGMGNQPSHATLLQESLGVADIATRAIAKAMRLPCLVRVQVSLFLRSPCLR
jgi:hypothetical protein